MSGGTVTGGTFTGGDNFDQSGGAITVSGGNFNVVDNYNMSGGTYVSSGGTVNITDDVAISNGSFTVSGGNFNGGDKLTTSGGTLSFSGGTIDIEDDIELDGGTATISGGDIDAGDKFDITNASLTITGGTVDVVDDFSVNSGGSMDLQSGGVLNLQDHLLVTDGDLTVAGTITTTGDDLRLSGDANVTFNDPANASFDDIELMDDGAGGSTLTINGGTVSATDDLKFHDTADNDQIIINGGTLSVTNDIKDLDNSDASITGNGGSLEAAVIEDNALADEITVTGSGVVTEGGIEVLPVELLTFSGTVNNGRIEITWITAAEVNNELFELQRSLDGEHFEIVSVIQGNGTTNAQSTYKYYDDQILSDLVFYRLEQFDHDGKSEILPTISINTNNSSPSQNISVFPNPTATYLQVTMASKAGEGTSSISILDINGKVVWSNKDFNGFQKIDLMTLGLKEGVYLARLLQGDFQTTKRVIFKPSF